MIMLSGKNFNIVISYIILIISLSIGIYRNFFHIRYINLLYNNVTLNDFSWHNLIISAIVSAMIFSLVHYASMRYSSGSKNKILLVCSPLLILFPEALLPVNFFTPFVFVTTVGLSFYRFLSSLELNFPDDLPQKYRYLPIGIVVTVFLFFTAYGTYIQHCAWRSFYFVWVDWGLFFEMVKHTMDFRFGYTDYYGFNHLGVHFSPALIILLPAMFFKNVTVLFFLSSALLYGGGIAIYLLGRTLKLSKVISLMLALIYFFTPGLTNLNLAIYYGFHENYMALIFFLGAAIFWHRKNYFLMALMLLIGLCVKEFCMILVACLGFIFILQKRYKEGIILFITGTIAFFTVYLLFIPWLRDGESYFLMYRYSGLGNSTSEILLSAFTKPEIFWTRFLRLSVWSYIITLFLPFLILVGINPLVCLASGIILFFTCLQTDQWFVNIQCWYQVLPLITIYLCMTWNCQKLDEGTKPSKWLNFLDIGNKNNGQKLFPAVAATTISVMLFWIFWGQSPLGKVYLFPFKENYSPAMKRIEKLIPENTRITASWRPSGHLFFRKLSFKYDRNSLCDYVVLDLMCFRPKEVQDSFLLRDLVLQDKSFHLVTIEKSQGSLLLLFSREKNSKSLPMPQLLAAKQVDWNKLPAQLPVNNGIFEVKMSLQKQQNCYKADFYIRLKKKVNVDYLFTIGLKSKTQQKIWQFLAGDGLLPTWKWQPGEIYRISTVLPPDFIPQQGYCEVKQMGDQVSSNK